MLFFSLHFGCYRPCECAHEKCETFRLSQLNTDEDLGFFFFGADLRPDDDFGLVKTNAENEHRSLQEAKEGHFAARQWKEIREMVTFQGGQGNRQVETSRSAQEKEIQVE